MEATKWRPSARNAKILFFPFFSLFLFSVKTVRCWNGTSALSVVIKRGRSRRCRRMFTSLIANGCEKIQVLSLKMGVLVALVHHFDREKKQARKVKVGSKLTRDLNLTRVSNLTRETNKSLNCNARNHENFVFFSRSFSPPTNPAFSHHTHQQLMLWDSMQMISPFYTFII